jgi:hypothetical protein
VRPAGVRLRFYARGRPHTTDPTHPGPRRRGLIHPLPADAFGLPPGRGPTLQDGQCRDAPLSRFRRPAASPGTVMTALPAGVRQAEPADASTVGDVLAAAFADTSVATLLVGDRNVRKTALRRAFTAVAAWAVAHGSVYLRLDGAAAAIWLPGEASPQFDPLALPDNGRSIIDGRWTAGNAIDAAVLELGVDAAAGSGLETLAGLVRPSAVRHGTALVPSYLFAFGVDPDARGQHAAQELLATHHHRIDMAHATAYGMAIDRAGQQLLAGLGYQPDHVDQVTAGLALQWMRRTSPLHRPPLGGRTGLGRWGG